MDVRVLCIQNSSCKGIWKISLCFPASIIQKGSPGGNMESMRSKRKKRAVDKRNNGSKGPKVCLGNKKGQLDGPW